MNRKLALGFILVLATTASGQDQSVALRTIVETAGTPKAERLQVGDCKAQWSNTTKDAKGVATVVTYVVPFAQVDPLNVKMNLADGSSSVWLGTNNDVPAIRVAKKSGKDEESENFVASAQVQFKDGASAERAAALIRNYSQTCQPQTYGKLPTGGVELEQTVAAIIRASTPQSFMQFDREMRKNDLLQVAVDRCSVFVETVAYDPDNPNDLYGRDTTRVFADLRGTDRTDVMIRRNEGAYQVTMILGEMKPDAAEQTGSVTVTNRSSVRMGFKNQSNMLSLRMGDPDAARLLAAGIQRLSEQCRNAETANTSTPR